MSLEKESDWSDLVDHSFDPDSFGQLIPIKPEDWERYQKQVKESDGFDVDYVPGLCQRPHLVRPLHCSSSKLSAEVLSSAIAERNQRNQAEVGAPSLTCRSTLAIFFILLRPPMPLVLRGPTKLNCPRIVIQIASYSSGRNRLLMFKGFDVDYFPGLVRPIRCDSEFFAGVLSSAIAEHNQRNQAEVGAPITLQRIIKLNTQLYPGNLFYTFEANDADGKTRTYQAQLSMDYDTDHAIIFRVKSSPDV